MSSYDQCVPAERQGLKPALLRSRLLTLGWGALLLACSIDDRVLQGASATAGSAGTAGQHYSAGGDDGSEGGSPGDVPMGATSNGGAGEGNEAGDGPGPGPVPGCADLDDNGVSDCNETLAENPTFDANDAHWAADLNAGQAWSAEDASARQGSGSLAVVNSNMADIPNLSLASSRQCIRLMTGGWYEFGAQVLIESGQKTEGSSGLAAQFYRSDDCSGTKMESFGGTSPLVEKVGEWLRLELETEAPSNALSMSVQMVVIKPFKAPQISVLFDDVLVKQKE